MVTKDTRINWETDDDLRAALEGVDADGQPREIVRDGRTIAVIVSPGEFAGGARSDIWKDYDPEKARAALRELQTAFEGVDAEAWLRDVREARGQDSIGRPGD